MKRLVYCFDGTSNEYDANYPTNVVIMHKSITPKSDDRTEQIAKYYDGVGTQFGEKILGGAFGYGLFENIIEAYKHLVNHYQAGDEIYIFGFSRGAFTARSFGGLIGWCGIVDAGNPAAIDKAEKYYKKRLLKKESHTQQFNQWRLKNCSSVCANKDDYRYRRECQSSDYNIPKIVKIRYIGIWDTVKTLGLFNKYEWHDDHLSSQVEYARHAIALDERRKKFNVTEWGNIDELNQKILIQKNSNRPYQQVWFAGTHGSIGGGGSVRGLSDEAFEWVREGAKNAGLQFVESGDAEIFTLKPNPLAWLYNGAKENQTFLQKTQSLLFKGLYWVTGTIDRTGPAFLDDVHHAVIVRYFAQPDQLPEKKWYRPASLKQLKGTLTAMSPPFSVTDYRALYESSIETTLASDEQKIITISGNRFLVYTVKKGDTLSGIAKDLTGKAYYWKKIHQSNLAAIDNPDLVYIGQRIFIPFNLVS